MFKTTVTLLNGSTVDVEFQTNSELVDFIQMFEGIRPVAQKKVSVAEPEKVVTKQTRLVGEGAWSEDDIMFIVERFNEVGPVADASKQVTEAYYSAGRTHQIGAYSIVARIKQYMFNKKVGTLSQFVLKVLRKHKVQHTKVKLQDGKVIRTKKMGYKVHPLTEKEILGIATLIQTNPHVHMGLSKLVKDWLDQNGSKNRHSITSIYSTTSNFKMYLRKGASQYLSEFAKNVLRENGIAPEVKTEVKKSFLGNISDSMIRRVPVVEA